MTIENIQEVICPKCGESFTCTHNKSCWCTNYTLTNEAITYLKEHYKGCLCKKCLEEILAMYKINL